MKRYIAFTLIIAMLIVCSACGGGTNSLSSTNGAPNSSDSQQPSPEDAQTQAPEEFAYEITHQSALTYKNSIGTVWVQVILEIENTGTTDLYMNTGAYDLEDLDGKLVSSSTMLSAYPSVIAPGEKGYYYEETTLNELDEAIELTVLPRLKAEEAKVDQITYALSDLELTSDTYAGVRIKGRIENTTDEMKSLIYVYAALYDSDDNPIGVIFTILTEDLNPGDKIGFEMSGFSLPPNVTVDSVARLEAVAYPLQYQF